MHFEIDIQAAPERVWEAVVNVGPFEEWTSAFHEGSTFEGGWEKGSAIRFVALEDDGKKVGMVAEIAESRQPEFISIRTLGLIRGDVEDLTSEEARRWTPAYENYTLTPIAGGTRFVVDVDVNEEMADKFLEMWPAGLLKLKAIAERPA
jgi:uncharacterized protein YndB with AHSA1/START domain